MGLIDILTGQSNKTPTVTTILPDAARQEIMAGRLPILNPDSIFPRKGEKIQRKAAKGTGGIATRRKKFEGEEGRRKKGGRLGFNKC